MFTWMSCMCVYIYMYACVCVYIYIYVCIHICIYSYDVCIKRESAKYRHNFQNTSKHARKPCISHHMYIIIIKHVSCSTSMLANKTMMTICHPKCRTLYPPHVCASAASVHSAETDAWPRPSALSRKKRESRNRISAQSNKHEDM